MTEGASLNRRIQSVVVGVATLALNAGAAIKGSMDVPLASKRLDQRNHENGAAVDVLIHDLGGDLVFDGTYFYQYDSLHRLW